jgi:hypothetical protein
MSALAVEAKGLVKTEHPPGPGSAAGRYRTADHVRVAVRLRVAGSLGGAAYREFLIGGNPRANRGV